MSGEKTVAEEFSVLEKIERLKTDIAMRVGEIGTMAKLGIEAELSKHEGHQLDIEWLRSPMPKLTLRERWLYKRKKYDKLYELTLRTEEGTARFIELCVQDTSLQTWRGQHEQHLAATIFSDPKLTAGAKKALGLQGQGKLFDFYKGLHEKGFVTVDEAAAAFGMTTEEMKTTIAALPELFKELHISGC